MTNRFTCIAKAWVNINENKMKKIHEINKMDTIINNFKSEYALIYNNELTVCVCAKQ